MKLVLNTHLDDPSGRVCINGLHERLVQAGVDARLNDWDHYDRFDTAVFLGYDHDMESARRQNPKIRIALTDPKLSSKEWIQAARDADFLMVSSVEQRDVFYRLNRNILVFYMFPPMPALKKVHVRKEPVIIGYHGNRAHLECMTGRVQLALNELAKRRRIEFWALYNFPLLGKAEIGLPDARLLPTRHIAWSPISAEGALVSKVFFEEFVKVDIGIMPSEIPIRSRLDILQASMYPRPEFKYEPFDHLVRYKASANPGRLYPFARLGIPVVADFTPSASQFIRDGESGFIVSSPHGWMEALEALVDSPELRTQMALALEKRVEEEYRQQIDKFLEFCRRPLKKRPAIAGCAAVEDELARLKNYPQSKGRGRMAGRARGLVRRIRKGFR